MTRMMYKRAAFVGVLWIAGLALAGGGDAVLFPPERYLEHEKFLASDALEGRQPGTPGIEEAATYISFHFMMAGLQPGGASGTYYQPFEVRGGKRLTRSDAAMTFAGVEGEWQIGKDWTPMPFSAIGDISGPVAFAGFGIEYTPEPPSTQPDAQPATPELPYNDYGNFDATGKVLIIFRHEPRAKDPNSKFGGKEPSGKSLFVNKANLAADKGAKALIVVNPPDWDGNGDGKPDEDELYAWNDSERSSYRLPIVHISQALAEKLLAKGGLGDLRTLLGRLENERKPLAADLAGVTADVKTGVRNIEARNVIGVLVGSERPDEYIVVGAHYDHLGNIVPPFGGDGRQKQIHNGADDNASGTSGVLELARVIGAGPRPKRSIIFMTFSAEEMGLLGSAHYVKKPTVELSKIKAMINLDMIGRLGQDELEIYGTPSAKEFPELVAGLAKEHGINYKATKNNDRYFGASDHASFFYKGIPVLFAFTGTHPQYHKPEDDWELIDAEGATKLLGMFHQIVLRVANMDQGPTVPSVEEERATGTEQLPKTPAQQADEAAKQRAQGADSSEATPRRSRVQLGFMPAYDDPGPGALVERIVPGRAAEKAGMKKGDRIIKVGKKDVADFTGYMDAMKDVQPGDEIEVVVKRDSENVTLKIKVTSSGDRR